MEERLKKSTQTTLEFWTEIVDRETYTNGKPYREGDIFLITRLLGVIGYLEERLSGSQAAEEFYRAGYERCMKYHQIHN